MGGAQYFAFFSSLTQFRSFCLSLTFWVFEGRCETPTTSPSCPLQLAFYRASGMCSFLPWSLTSDIPPLVPHINKAAAPSEGSMFSEMSPQPGTSTALHVKNSPRWHQGVCKALFQQWLSRGPKQGKLSRGIKNTEKTGAQKGQNFMRGEIALVRTHPPGQQHCAL